MKGNISLKDKLAENHINGHNERQRLIIRKRSLMPFRVEETEKTSSGRPIDLAKSDAIIAAACKLFFQIGFTQTSIEAIAALAGVSKVTVYNRFGTKEALFTAAVEAECDTMRKNINFKDIQNGDLRQTLIDFGMNMTSFLNRAEMMSFEKHLSIEAEHNPIVGQLFLDAGPHRLHASLSSLLDHAVSNGHLRIDDTLLAAELLAGMIKGLSDIERRFGHNDPNSAERTQKRVTSAVDLFLSGYAKS
jgi:TetR/AcrR family transcriptional regulator, mexJK operon transcriptional repressor